MLKTIVIILLILVYLVLVNGIVNNGNILTDGKWKCYYELQKKVCIRK